MNTHLNTLKTKNYQNSYKNDKFRFSNKDKKPYGYTPKISILNNSFITEIKNYKFNYRNQKDRFIFMDEFHVLFNRNIMENILNIKDNILESLISVEISGSYDDILNFLLNTIKQDDVLSHIFNSYFYNTTETKNIFYSLGAMNKTSVPFFKNYVNNTHNLTSDTEHFVNPTSSSDVLFVEDKEIKRLLLLMENLPPLFNKNNLSLNFFAFFKNFEQFSNLKIFNSSLFLESFESLEHDRVTQIICGNIIFKFKKNIINNVKSEHIKMIPYPDLGYIHLLMNSEILMINQKLDFISEIKISYKELNTYILRHFSPFSFLLTSKHKEWNIQKNSLPEYLYSLLKKFTSNEIEQQFHYFCKSISNKWSFMMEEYEMSQLVPVIEDNSQQVKILKF